MTGVAKNLRWHAANREKHLAHKAVAYALSVGKMSRQPCEVCGSTTNIHAHHDDYSKKLDIRWLCPIHHQQRHQELAFIDAPTSPTLPGSGRRSKLKPEDVLQIIASKDSSTDDLAKRFGVSKSQINAIRVGRKWSHVTGIIHPSRNTTSSLSGEGRASSSRCIAVQLRGPALTPMSADRGFSLTR